MASPRDLILFKAAWKRLPWRSLLYYWHNTILIKYERSFKPRFSFYMRPKLHRLGFHWWEQRIRADKTNYLQCFLCEKKKQKHGY